MKGKTMSKKRRADSIWDALPKNQKEALAQWLFEDHIKIRDAQARAADEFQCEASVESLRRWYHRTARERKLSEMEEKASSARALLKGLGHKPEEAYRALLGVIGHRALDLATEKDEVDMNLLKELADLMELGLKAHQGADQLQLKQRDLELRAKKYRDGKAALEAAGPKLEAGLTDEMLEEIERDLNLM